MRQLAKATFLEWVKSKRHQKRHSPRPKSFSWGARRDFSARGRLQNQGVAPVEVLGSTLDPGDCLIRALEQSPPKLVDSPGSTNMVKVSWFCQHGATNLVLPTWFYQHGFYQHGKGFSISFAFKKKAGKW